MTKSVEQAKREVAVVAKIARRVSKKFRVPVAALLSSTATVEAMFALAERKGLIK